MFIFVLYIVGDRTYQYSIPGIYAIDKKVTCAIDRCMTCTQGLIYRLQFGVTVGYLHVRQACDTCNTSRLAMGQLHR